MMASPSFASVLRAFSHRRSRRNSLSTRRSSASRRLRLYWSAPLACRESLLACIFCRPGHQRDTAGRGIFKSSIGASHRGGSVLVVVRSPGAL
jgi:hypothetical protein